MGFSEIKKTTQDSHEEIDGGGKGGRGAQAGADVLLFHHSLAVQKELKDNKTEQIHRR